MTRSAAPSARAGLAAAAWEPSPRAAWIAVAVLTVLAAILRLARISHSPPGLNQDEAINAWNSFCLLKTGRDMVGAHWPLFYAHSIGDNRTTLLLYWILPFQALGGLTVTSMRAASAVSGILCVPLIAYVGTRLFGRAAGLVAAALLVVNPWHFASTRWAIDGSLVPFLTLATLAAMLGAGLPFADGGVARPRAWAAALAGLVAGAGCYGYWAMRLHLPVFLALALLLTWRHWRAMLRTGAGRAAAVAFALGLAATYGPLAYRHLVDPAIAIRAAMTRLWEPGTPLPEIVQRVLARYAIHFGPDFLFVRGDMDPGNSPADSGVFEWAVLPLMLVGLFAAFRRIRSSASSAFLVALVLAYPVGDLVSRYDGVHAFRSSPGMAGLLLLAAWGAVSAWHWLRGRGRALAWGAAAVVAGATLVQDARSTATYFGEWPDRPGVYFLFHADFMQACAWVRPRVRDVDAVFWTTTGVNMPFAMTLVGLGYDPARWLSDPKVKGRDAAGWDHYVRYGNNYFLYDQLCRPYVEAMQTDDRVEHAFFVVRPHELGLEDPVHVVRGPHGEELLWICREDL
jgi:hypothetical protein